MLLMYKYCMHVANTLCTSATFPESLKIVDIDGTHDIERVASSCVGTESGGDGLLTSLCILVLLCAKCRHNIHLLMVSLCF
jgi:hypothetical protein